MKFHVFLKPITALGILKTNEGVTNNSKIKRLRYFGLGSSALASKAKTATKNG